MKRPVIFLLLVIYSLVSLSAAIKGDFLATLTGEEREFLRTHPTITVVYDPAKAPLEYVEGSQAKGISKAYLDEISSRTGLRFQIILDTPWAEGSRLFKEGRIDMAAALNPTDERRQYALFTETYLDIPIVLMAKSQVGYVGSLAGIGDRTLAVVGEYSAAEWVRRDWPDIHLVTVPTNEEGLRLVHQGKAFAIMGNLMVLNHYASTLGMTDALKVVGTTPYTNSFAMAVHQSRSPLLSILQKALDLIDAESRQQLYSQNMPLWYSWVLSRRAQLFLLIGIAVLLIILALWIVTLTIQMRRNEEAERQTHIGELRFRRLFDQSPIPFLLIDLDGRILGTNERWNQLFKLPVQAFGTIEELFERIYPQERERGQSVERWEQIKSKGVTHTDEGRIDVFERTIIAGDGQRRTLEVSGAPLSDMYLVSYVDVTERNRDLEELSRLHQQMQRNQRIIFSALEDQQRSELSLKQSQATLKAAISSMLDAVYIIDLDTSFVMMSDAFYTYYRLRRSEQTPKSLEAFKSLFDAYDDAGNPIGHSMWVAYRALRGESGRTEYQLVKRDSGQRWYGSYSYAPIHDEAGAISGAIIVCRDVTEERETAKQLRFQRDHDYLTGLYSRVYFEQTLQQLQRSLPLTVGLVDINGLKLVNDTLGHAIGDEVIKITARLLEEHKDEGTIIARYGGDEFAFLMEGQQEAAAEAFIRRVEDAAKTISIESFHLSLSAGWATRSFLSELPDQTLRRAEEEMGRAKIYESASAKSKSVGLLMASLFEKSRRESHHSRRVSALSAFIAKQLDLSEREVGRIRTAALMHDIGKIGISEAILNKPGHLDERQWEEMKRHPEIGYRILNAASEFSDLAPAVLEHHERWNGSGYPQGLVADQISYQARIIAIADSYDAMTSTRSYRIPISQEEAIEEIFNNRGILYDPQIVQVFVSTIAEFEEQRSEGDTPMIEPFVIT